MMSFEHTIRSLCRRSRVHDVVTVGPVVWYAAGDGCPYPGAAPDDRVWAAIVAASHDTPRGPAFHSDLLIFGIAAAEAPEWARDCSTVIEVRTLRHPHEITREEAGRMRARLANGLRKRFAEVRLFDKELDVARFCARRWPGKKVARLLAELKVELLAELKVEKG